MEIMAIYLKEVRRDCNSGMTHEEQASLHEAAKRGDQGARHQLILSALPWGICVAKRYVGRGVDIEDLVQLAGLGVMRAVDKWDPSIARLTTYATVWAKQRILYYMSNRGFIRIPASARHRQRLAMSAGTYEQMEDFKVVACSIDAALDDGRALRDTIEDKKAAQPAEVLEETETRAKTVQAVRQQMQFIEMRLREILYRRVMGESLDQIAESFGISKERVRQLEARGFAELAARFGRLDLKQELAAKKAESRRLCYEKQRNRQAASA